MFVHGSGEPIPSILKLSTLTSVGVRATGTTPR
jgi:hypothetical protein